MTKFIISGMDVHEKSIKIMWSVQNGEPALLDFPNSPAGRRALILHLQRVARAAGTATIVTAYEACSLGFGLYDEFLAAGITCHVLAPSLIRKSRRDVRRKTDEADARLIFETLRGHLLAGNSLPRVWVPSVALRADRELVRARLELGNKLTELKTQIGMLLKSHGISRPEKIGQPWTLSHRDWLASLTRPESRLALQTQFVLDSFLRQLRHMEEELKRLDKAVEILAMSKGYRTIVETLTNSIKGVGILTAMVFLSELGDLTRFKNRRQLASYLGLTPTSNESGEITDRKGHISRCGPSRVRWVLNQATWSHIHHTPEAKAVFERIGKGKKKLNRVAQTACVRRLAIRMWHIALDAARTEPSRKVA